jgi:ABC-type enterochelin transport system ATPase subunit
MLLLRNVTDEHLNKWVVTRFGSNVVVAYDTDVLVALEKAKAAGEKQQDAVIMFVHPDNMTHIYATELREKNIYEVLGDQRKSVSLPIDQSFLG